MKVALALSVAGLACSQATGPVPDTMLEDPIAAAFPQRCEDVACATGPTITSARELVSIVEASSDWISVGPYTTGCLTGSADLRVTGTVTVQGDSIAVPTYCKSRMDCRHAVRFRGSPLPLGVDCVDPESWYDFTLCGAITIHDTTIRVRAVSQDIHPSGFGNAAPVVEVLAACASACGSEQHACEATHTCWREVRDHCAYCLNGTNEACACWTGGGFQADGTDCTFAISGDVYVLGTCQHGTCVQTP